MHLILDSAAGSGLRTAAVRPKQNNGKHNLTNLPNDFFDSATMSRQRALLLLIVFDVLLLCCDALLPFVR